MAKGWFVVRGAIRRLGRGEYPGQGLPLPGRPVDPGYGVEGPEGPEISPPEEDLSPEQLPWYPVDPDEGKPGHLPSLPPGSVWPPINPGAPGHLPAPIPSTLWIIAYVPGVGKRYVKVDLSKVPPLPPTPTPMR